MVFIPSHRGITPTPDQLEELRINGEDGSTVSDEAVQESWRRIIEAEQEDEF